MAYYWDTFEHRLEITADLTAETALRVGAGGESAEPSVTDLPVLRDALQRPYLPGSSLRGVLRSHIERIVRSLETEAGDGRGACRPTHSEKEWCLKSHDIEGWQAKARNRDDGDEWLAGQIWTHSCRVCRVFGNPWLASRVRLTDLYAPQEIWIERRDGVAIDRDKETVQNKYDFETITAGAKFRLFIDAENLVEEERGLLWLGVRELERGHIQLGGFKGRGLGRVSLAGLKVRGVSRDNLRDYLLSGEMAPVPLADMDSWLQLVVGKLGKEAE